MRADTRSGVSTNVVGITGIWLEGKSGFIN